jgi:hypothetical protein
MQNDFVALGICFMTVSRNARAPGIGHAFSGGERAEQPKTVATF